MIKSNMCFKSTCLRSIYIHTVYPRKLPGGIPKRKPSQALKNL